MTTNLHCCPTCGAELADQVSYDSENRTFIANGASVRFSPGQAEVFNAIWRARQRGGITSMERLAEVAWADRMDGGPGSYNTVSVQLVHIRSRLAATGYTITRNIGRPKEGYRLTKAEA